MPPSRRMCRPVPAPLPAKGDLDCNGFSTAQKELRANLCTDISGAHQGRLGRQVLRQRLVHRPRRARHQFHSRPGSSANVTWTQTLGRDPRSGAAVNDPGQDVSHWFELIPRRGTRWRCATPTPIRSCPANPNRYKPTASDPWAATQGAAARPSWSCSSTRQDTRRSWTGISCDDTHWCAALTIDSLECTAGFATCNTNCIEPVNFAFIQTQRRANGPPGPQEGDHGTFTPNAHTLLMNPGDTITGAHVRRASPGRRQGLQSGDRRPHEAHERLHAGVGRERLPDHLDGGLLGHAVQLRARVLDGLAGQHHPVGGAPDRHQHRVRDRPLRAMHLAQGPDHQPFDPSDTGGDLQRVSGPYEKAASSDSTTTEQARHSATTPATPTPATTARAHRPAGPDDGCQDNVFQNGDLDFDGTPYCTEWPTGNIPEATRPPSSNSSRQRGQTLLQVLLPDRVALSESSCLGNSVGPGGTSSGVARCPRRDLAISIRTGAQSTQL